MLEHRVSARTLVEFSHLKGDLFPAMQAAERMQDGAQVHRMRQAGYGADFEREVTFKVTEAFGGVFLTVYGRADGLNQKSDPPVIEEIKSTRLDPRLIGEDDHPVHWAQADVYAYALSTQGVRRVEVRLAYVSPGGDANVFSRVRTAEELRVAFLSCAQPYAQWVARLDARRQASLPTMRALVFPYDGYRDGQRDMAARSYLAIKHGGVLLVEAPTGIGKTAAALFAAVKAMGEGHAARAFYLTARTTARRAAECAIDLMREKGLCLRSITLTAKEKLCPEQSGRCDPTLCPRAQGYFDRRQAALDAALEIDRLTRDAVVRVADEFALCPFEIQLDMSLTCDVVICDYNYAFDPRVRLKRFFQDKFDGALLVDEAHNLITRARDMLSAQLRMADFVALRRALKKLDGQGTPLYGAIEALIDTFKGLRESYEQPCWQEEAPEQLVERTDMFLDAARPFMGAASAFSKELTDRCFEGLNFLRVAQEMGPEHRTLYEAGEGDLSVRLWCFDPSKYLEGCYRRAHGTVLFSATLSPMQYYRDMLGLDEDRGDELLALPSPFPPENLLVVKVPVATTFKKREQTCAQVARAVLTMCAARRGNYLACFPSYAYMRLVGAHIASQAGDIQVVMQRPGMTEAERDRFLRAFAPNPKRTLLALVAMGGVFAEGVDLPGDLLLGAAIVGVGLPQISLERAALAHLTDDGFEGGSGVHNAYTYPGLERVLQAAGRVIRSEQDQGVVLLIDERFDQEGYDALFPPHWEVQRAQEEALPALLEAFWSGAQAPR